MNTLGPSPAGHRLVTMPAEIDEASIALLVEEFYLRVRRDLLLAPVFETAIGTTDADWAGHLALLRDFWSSIMLTSGRYHGNPKAAHLNLPDLEPAMFERWLTLFRASCADVFEPHLGDAFVQRAERIGQSLLRGLGSRPTAASGDAGQ